MSTSALPPLEYAPAAPILRRRRIRRILSIVVLLAIALPIYRYGPPAWRKSKILYNQHRCLTFAAAPDQLVYDDDPADAAVIGARRNYQLLSNQNFRAPRFPRMAAYSPPCWNDLTAAAFPSRSPIGSAAVIFCHELTSRDGVRRLVIVQRSSNPPGYNYNYLSLDFLLIQPATLTANPIDVTPAPKIVWHTGATARQSAPLRIFAGQAAPADPSRFTIRYALGKSQHLLEGRLADGGNDVTLAYLKPLADSPP